MDTVNRSIGCLGSSIITCLFATLLIWDLSRTGDAHGAGTDGRRGLELVRDGGPLRISGLIYPNRFNLRTHEGARYHLITWNGGTSDGALIETEVDDLDFHDALIELGALPGNNLSMQSWEQRNDRNSISPEKRLEGSALSLKLEWAGGVLFPMEDAFRKVRVTEEAATGLSEITWTFGGNRDRWFNNIPFSPRPGCLVCLYSCPSGKVGNGELSVAEYERYPTRFEVDTAKLPADGTEVTVVFEVVRQRPGND